MKFFYTAKFKASFRKLSEETKKKFYKQSGYLLKNLQHPSLRAKKYEEELDIWQARVNKGYRFYFTIKGDTYILLDIKIHPK